MEVGSALDHVNGESPQRVSSSPVRMGIVQKTHSPFNYPVLLPIFGLRARLELDTQDECLILHAPRKYQNTLLVDFESCPIYRVVV